MRPPAAPALPEKLLWLLRRMRLPYVRAAAPEVLATARAQRWDPAEVLRVLLAEDARGRDAATQRMRRKAQAERPRDDGSRRSAASWADSLPPPSRRGGAWQGRFEHVSGRTVHARRDAVSPIAHLPSLSSMVAVRGLDGME